MGTKRNILRNGVILATSILSVSMCFSIGFASWVSVGGDFGNIDGNIDADKTVLKYSEIDNCFSFDSGLVKQIEYNETYGLVNPDGLYTKSNNCPLTIEGMVTFNGPTAYNVENPALTKNDILIRIAIAAFDSSGNYVYIKTSSNFVYVDSISLKITNSESSLFKKGDLLDVRQINDDGTENDYKRGQYFYYTSNKGTASFTYTINLICPSFSNYNKDNTFEIYAYAEDSIV